MPLTPEQFEQLATKQYLSEKLENFATKDDIRSIADTLDYIVKKVDNNESELTTNIGAHDRIQENIQAIDVRVKKLEAAL